jgi:uncharacterized membrane protein
MSLQSKLRDWEEAGLVDRATCERILQHEHGHTRPYALYVVGGLGALAVVLGIISLIAANWDQIPRLAKMVLDLLLLVGLAWAVLRADDGDRPWLREVLLLLYAGLALASVGLIGQSYHLGGRISQALLVWTAMVLPALLILGRSVAVAVAIVAAIDVTVVVGAVDALETSPVGDLAETFVLGSLVALLPLVHVACSMWPALRRRGPDLARVCGVIGWLAVIVGSLIAQHFWYDHNHVNDETLRGLLLVVPLVVGLTVWMGVRAGRDTADRKLVLSFRVVLGYSVLAALIPLLVPHGRLGVLSALSVVGFSAVLAWAAFLRQQIWLFNLSSAALALRVIIVFIELFGSLVSTGLGLIAGGVLTLVVAGLWVKQTKRLRQRMRQSGGEP